MHSHPGYLIRRAHQIANAAFNSVARQHDITPVQFAALLTIRDNPGIDATRLSDLIRFDRTTIGHVIGRLEQKKLIGRKEGLVDKRAKTMEVTPQGSALVDALGATVDKMGDTTLAPLTKLERTQFLAMLQKLDQNSNWNGRQSNNGIT